MMIVVKHKRTENDYILLGISGLGEKNNHSPRFLTDLFNQENSEPSNLMAVCDARGNIFLADIKDLIILEIDGKKPSEILPEIPVSSVNSEYNPETKSDFDDEFEDDEDIFYSEEPEKSSEPTIESTSSSNQSDDKDFDDDEEWI